MVYLDITSESEPAFDIGGQGNLIGEIKLRLQVERTSINEVVAVMERRTVGKDVLAPVDHHISGKDGYASVKVECHGVVADKVEIVTGLARELSHRDAPLFAVGLVGPEILAAERPSVAVAPCEYRVENSEIITAIAGVACIEAVGHVRLYFHGRHTGEASLGHCPPREKGKHGSEDNHRFSHRLLYAKFINHICSHDVLVIHYKGLMAATFFLGDLDNELLVVRDSEFL